MTSMTKEWVRKAESDFQLAVQLDENDESFHDQLCFHCQQAAEKYVKAILQELGLKVPRTHMVRDLVDLLLGIHPDLRSIRRGAAFLTRFAVETRYPGRSATKRQAAAALSWATKTRAVVRQILGIPA